MYGLTCTITDPTDGEMDKWEKGRPPYMIPIILSTTNTTMIRFMVVLNV